MTASTRETADDLHSVAKDHGLTLGRVRLGRVRLGRLTLGRARLGRAGAGPGWGKGGLLLASVGDRVSRMSAGEIAGLIAAVAFVLLVGASAVPLLKLGKVLDETRIVVRGVGEGTVPLLHEVTTTVATTNAQLVRVDAITSNVQTMSSNVSALTSVFAATLGSPAVKVAAFSYGVRSALSGRRHKAEDRRVRDQLRAERAGRRRGA